MEKTDRTERLLALLLLQQIKGAPQRDKIMLLNLAGFSNLEIADILETTSAVVSQSLYEARRQPSRASGKAGARKRKVS